MLVVAGAEGGDPVGEVVGARRARFSGAGVVDQVLREGLFRAGAHQGFGQFVEAFGRPRSHHDEVTKPAGGFVPGRKRRVVPDELEAFFGFG